MPLPRGYAIRAQEDTHEYWLPNAGELFAGFDGGCEHRVIIASLIDTLHRFPFWAGVGLLLRRFPSDECANFFANAGYVSPNRDLL